MEMFIALLVIAIIVGVVIFISARDPGDLHLNIQGSPARITLDEAKQVNRVTYLQLISPELARALAGKLQGDAWQLVQSGLCVSWLNEGRQDAALQLLGKLDPHHRGVALSNLLRHLIEAGEERQALELLAQSGDELPAQPLLRVALLRAEGRLDEARAELSELDTYKGNADILHLTQLARQQRELEQRDAALHSLDLAWQLMQGSAAVDEYLGLDVLLAELAALGEFSRLQAIAEQLPVAQRPAAIAELIRAGLFEQARALLQGLAQYQSESLQEQMFGAMLARDQLIQAEELLGQVTNAQHTTLLVRLAQWHIVRGSFETAAARLQAHARSPQERIDLYLSLWKLQVGERPELAARLLDQAEGWVAQLTEDEQDDLRFFVLDARLSTQSLLPERQRTSYEIRRGLEEMERLLQGMDSYSRIANLGLLARLLHKLGRAEDALTKLAQARELLSRSGPQDDLEDLDKALLLEDIATTYLQLQRLDLALAARAEIPESEIFDERDWIAALIEHDHLQQAIETLDLRTLFAVAAPLASLTGKLAELADQGQALRGQLLAKLSSDAFWEPAASAA